MDAVERLSPAEVRSGTLIASEHLHRYELAGALCRGLRVADVCCGSGYGAELLHDAGALFVLGVDVDAPTIERAKKDFAAPPKLELAQADALEFLERDLAPSLDAIVMFEGLEHVPDPERALAALARHAAAGMRLIVSIPNSRALGEEDNPFHLTDFGYEEARAALTGLGERVDLLYQYAAEGSMIRGDQVADGPSVDGRIVLPDHGEPHLCSHLIGLVNFDLTALERAGSSRMQLAVAPLNRRYMQELERKVGELWEELSVNERRYQATLAEIEGSVSWRITAPLRRARGVGRSREGS